MIMEDIIRFVEKCGFSISNKEDFNKIEIRDLENDEPLERLKKFSQDRQIVKE